MMRFINLDTVQEILNVGDEVVGIAYRDDETGKIRWKSLEECEYHIEEGECLQEYLNFFNISEDILRRMKLMRPHDWLPVIHAMYNHYAVYYLPEEVPFSCTAHFLNTYKSWNTR